MVNTILTFPCPSICLDEGKLSGQYLSQLPCQPFFSALIDRQLEASQTASYQECTGELQQGSTQQHQMLPNLFQIEHY